MRMTGDGGYERNTLNFTISKQIPQQVFKKIKPTYLKFYVCLLAYSNLAS